MIIEAGLTRYEAVNKEIEKQLEKQNKVTVKDVNGERYIGCALDEGKTIEVYGTLQRYGLLFKRRQGCCFRKLSGTQSAIQWAAAKLLSTVTPVTLWVTVCVTVKFISVIMLFAVAVFI